MSGADPMLVDTVDRLLADVCPATEVEHAEAAGWSATTWAALADAGFPWVGLAGGSGGSLNDAAAILAAVGRSAAPVPVAETGMIGGWCLTQAGLALPSGPLSVVEPQSAELDGGRVRIDGVGAFARHAERIVAVAGDSVLSLRPEQVTITPAVNLAGEARDRVVADLAIDDVERGPLGANAGDVERRGALSRIVMAAGALAAVSQMTVDYTNERRQFGKPVATFQAVQHHLVVVAQSAVRAQMAADVAVRALEHGHDGIDVAAARVVVDDAIALGTRAAHQAHGAMGVTREYPLHQLTRRLWSWRHEWGTAAVWRQRLGAHVHARGADELFATITG